MPLDGHDFLVSQGWSGKGAGLRDGAISRPLAIPQKKNLAGLGKDRDEAFPFWDHLFSAAAKSIQLKFASDDESDGDSSLPEIKRTTTGIMSNRRPVTGVSATTSGTSTPDASDENPRLSLLSVAKRNAARSSLYARFFRGPILGPDDDSSTPTPIPPNDVEADKRKDKERRGGNEDAGTLVKKRKRDSEDDAARRQRKKEEKELKAKEKEARRVRRRDRRAAREAQEKQATESSEKREKKRQRQKAKEGKESDNKGEDPTLEPEKRKKKGKSRKEDAGTVTTPDDSNGGQCTHLSEVAPTFDPDIIEAVTNDQQPSNEPPERKKRKKRKQEEV
ncbi:hypothetical protein C0991_004492 [Blastosporella zonata]|nr:hypothetical protein C0991_004492 [Blastosporella zonata]